MPAPRIPMRHLKELFRLKYAAGLSHRQIATSLNISTGVPFSISVDKHASYPDAFSASQQEKILPTDCQLRRDARGELSERNSPADHRWYSAFVVAELIITQLKTLNPRYPPAKAEEQKEMAKARKSLKGEA